MKRTCFKFHRYYGFLFVVAFTSTVSAQKFPELSESFRVKQLEPPTGKVRMVLDTDTINEIDDQFALAYTVLSTDKLDLEAIYAMPFFREKDLARASSPADGMEKSYAEILKILKMLNEPAEGRVFRGSRDYLNDVKKPHRSEAALDLVERAMKSSPENPLYVVPIGVLTNIASALLIEPKIINRIVVVWLGGNSHHWLTQNEFNLQQDLRSARVVFDSGVPLVVMPCVGVVTHFHTSLPELRYHLKGKNEISDYLVNNVEEYSEGQRVYSKVIWDVVAVAWLVNHKWVYTNLVHSPVITDRSGVSIKTSRHLMRIAKTLNRDRIFEDLFSKLAKAHEN